MLIIISIGDVLFDLVFSPKLEQRDVVCTTKVSYTFFILLTGTHFCGAKKASTREPYCVLTMQHGLRWRSLSRHWRARRRKSQTADTG